VLIVETDGTQLVAVKRTDLDLEDDGGKARALATYDNRVGQLDLDWDIEALGAVDADVLGDLWNDKELEDMGWDFGEPAEDPGAQMDKAEELREKWGVETGQLWQLGEHRLICGDCTDRQVVERVMGGEKAGAVVTDPPYGMNLDADYSSLTSDKSFGKGRRHAAVIGDDKPFDASIVNGCDCEEQFWFGADYYAKSLGDTERSGAWLVWDKRLTDSADLMYGSCFELIWSKQKHKRDMLRHKWAGFFTDGKERTYLHPTEKPVELIENIIMMADHAIIVYDPFLGSGTTLIACERLNRKCRAVEISPAYCAVAIQRWVDMTGGEPVLVNT
jgi:DNA modification methylase